VRLPGVRAGGARKCERGGAYPVFPRRAMPATAACEIKRGSGCRPVVLSRSRRREGSLRESDPQASLEATSSSRTVPNRAHHISKEDTEPTPFPASIVDGLDAEVSK